MFQGFGEQMEVFDCVITIKENDSVTQQGITAPRIIIEQQFVQLVQHACQVDFPVSVGLSRMATCYDGYRSEWIEREHNIVFSNLAYVENERVI